MKYVTQEIAGAEAVSFILQQKRKECYVEENSRKIPVRDPSTLCGRKIFKKFDMKKDRHNAYENRHRYSHFQLQCLQLSSGYAYNNARDVTINLLRPAVTLHTTKFNIQKYYVVLTLLLCISYGSQNKPRLLRYTTLTE
jgi:hypothetical protein